MRGFRNVERGHHAMAMDLVEDAAAGRAFDEDAPPAVAHAVRALMSRSSARPERVAAAARAALAQGWADVYPADDVAIRIGSLVELQADAATRSARGRDPDDALEAAGDFHHLPAGRQEAIATALNRGLVLSARAAGEMADDAAAARRAEPSFTRNVPRDAAEDLRRDVDAARVQLGLAADEWRQPGERGRVALLLHVQIPAMLAAGGQAHRSDPANAAAIAAETRVIREDPRQAVDGPRGIAANLRLARRMVSWLAPTLDPQVRDLVRPDGGVEALIRRTRGPASRTAELRRAAETALAA